MMSCVVILFRYDVMLEVKISMMSCMIILSRYDVMLEVKMDTLIPFNDTYHPLDSQVKAARPSGKFKSFLKK